MTVSWVSSEVDDQIRGHLVPFGSCRLAREFEQRGVDHLVIKYVDSRWAGRYATPSALKISDSPLQTWGTATYVTPIIYPLSTALYGRIGLVAPFDPSDWTVFDATGPVGRTLYQRWARSQPTFDQLVLTVHSTLANQELRNSFRIEYGIDCVLFPPDQEAHLHTDTTRHTWMAVSDWITHPALKEPTGESESRGLDTGFSRRLGHARFTVLVDEDFDLSADSLPVSIAPRLIEPFTNPFVRAGQARGQGIMSARRSRRLPADIADAYHHGSYVHLYLEP